MKCAEPVCLDHSVPPKQLRTSLPLVVGLLTLLTATDLRNFLQSSAVAAEALEAQPIKIGGSSTVYPIMVLAVKEYEARSGGGKVELNESGSTDGLRQFCAGKLAVANASRPINSKELKACAKNGVSFIELPIAFDAITVVVHPKNNWAKMISLKELARLWGAQAQGKVDRWNQVNIDWPDKPITLCGPGGNSGTFDYFNKAINGNEKNSRRDYTASEDDEVLVRCVANNNNALGYFGIGHYKANANKLRALDVVGPYGSIAPSIASVQSGKYSPLSRPLFLYINDKQLIANSQLRSFVTTTVTNGLRLTESAGSIPLPPSTYRLVETKLYKHVLGTSFGGDLPIGLTIGEALRRSFSELKQPQAR